jgi:serine/threonine protein kinase
MNHRTTTHSFIPSRRCRHGSAYVHTHLLTLHRRLPEAITRFVGSQMVAMIGYLHQEGYIARNLLPDNVYFDAAGKLHFLDFFLTLPVAAGRAAVDDESLVPEYMTPELALGGEETRVADWWRLGVLLYELSVGIPPFRPNSSSVTRAEQTQDIAQRLGNHAPAEQVAVVCVDLGVVARIDRLCDCV